MAVGISYLFIVMSVVSFMLGVFVVYKNKRNQRYNWLFLLISVANGCLNMSYACIGMQGENGADPLFTVIYITSLLTFLLTTLQLILYWVKLTSISYKIISLISFLNGAVLFAMVAIKGIVRYVPYTFGFYYEFSNMGFRIIYYVLGIILLGIPMGLAIHGYRKARYRRERCMATSVIIIQLFMILGALWDFGTVSFLHPIFPGSVIAQFVGVIFIFLVSEQYNISRFTLENVSEYIYSAVDVPIFIRKEGGKICFVNDRCPQFFGLSKEELLNMRLKNLFCKEDIQFEENASEEKKDTILRAKCILNDRKCEIQRTILYDRYHEFMGEMMLVYDVTDRANMLDALLESREEAIRANNAKSAFLANMSHELRTPMNAIVGMSELLLSREVPDNIKNELATINAAGSDLLSIINDILDISKIESGKYEIIETEYMLSKVITNVINMMSIRLLDKHIYLLLEMDPDIPTVLFGDDMRLKQILINIIGNAVKFTKKGYITVHIWSNPISEQEIQLMISVKDTGIGIQEENMNQLFGMFSQVDTKKNRKITGTGLGLAITKNLCELMGGHIEVESEYGKGTTFTLSVKQKIEDNSSMIQIQHKDRINILVYEIIDYVSENIDHVLSSLDIPHIMCDDLTVFHEHTDISHLIIQKKHFMRNRSNFESMFSKNQIILLMDIGEENDPVWKEYKQAYLPLLYLQIGIVMNNLSAENETLGNNFTIVPMPQAKVLVVDDNQTNLMVIEGMLEPYKMQVDVALSGFDALVLVEKEKYDAIFMDYMMPDMDGVDTTRRIRAMEGEYFKTVPIIALTAHAFTGIRESFLQKGFDEYLDKPVQYRKLDMVLKRFLQPRYSLSVHQENWEEPGLTEKELKEPEIIRESIEGVHMKKSVEALGGSLQIYLKVLRTFIPDMEKRKEEILALLEEQDLKQFIICIHAMKGASYGVGADKLGKLAEALEIAGKAGDSKWVQENIDDFMRELDHILAGIKEYLEDMEKVKSSYEKLMSEKIYRAHIPAEELQAIRSACEEMDFQSLEVMLDNMNQYDYSDEDTRHLKELTVAYNSFDYDSIMELINDIL